MLLVKCSGHLKVARLTELTVVNNRNSSLYIGQDRLLGFSLPHPKPTLFTNSNNFNNPLTMTSNVRHHTNINNQLTLPHAIDIPLIVYCQKQNN